MDSDSINRKSKNSSKRVKFKDENGNSKHSSEDSGSSNDSDALSEILNSVEGTKSNGNSGIIKGSGNKNDIEIHKGPKDESGSSNQSEVAQGEIDRSKGDISTENISSPSSSSSSSLSSPSSGSSTDDKSQADTQESGISGLTSGKSSSILKQTQNGSAGSTSNSQVPIVAQESALTQSPPIQVMDRGVEEYDPYRIPSAVFSISKSSAPMDWSLASNDSLFSIKVGSTSFARDLIQNKETARGVKKPGEVKALIPFLAVAPMYTENFEFDKSKETVVSDDTVKDKTAITAEEPIVDKSLSIAPWNQPNISESGIGQ
ncbi:cell wall protein RBR3 isoform X3 [Gossypium australe]|uniref:Cell wall protein RBR3 isoform X3 n=1 Tax=Gossypium australe TaxID=47621 RepID=A0A5B6UZL5_9ROSI|nr:cell wall protein RBR3 isoform X3 [Gossypium australe]